MYVQWWEWVGQVFVMLYVGHVCVYRAVGVGRFRVFWALVEWGRCGQWGIVHISPRVGWDGTLLCRGIPSGLRPCAAGHLLWCRWCDRCGFAYRCGWWNTRPRARPAARGLNVLWVPRFGVVYPRGRGGARGPPPPYYSAAHNVSV